MNPYGDVILDHFRHPRNYGSIETPDIRHEAVNPFCGDRVRIEVAIDAQRTVGAARFQGDLCMIAKASCSILTGMITGQTLRAAEQIADAQLLEALHAEIRPARLPCALLPLKTLREGIASYLSSRH